MFNGEPTECLSLGPWSACSLGSRKRDAVCGRDTKSPPFIRTLRPRCRAERRKVPNRGRVDTSPFWLVPQPLSSFSPPNPRFLSPDGKWSVVSNKVRSDPSSITTSVCQPTVQRKCGSWLLLSQWPGVAAHRKCPSECWMSCVPKETGRKDTLGRGSQWC